MVIEKTPEFISSVERLNVFHHVHHCNAQILKLIGRAFEALLDNPDSTLTPEALKTLLGEVGDYSQSVDGLMHIAQKQMVGPAADFLENASNEEAIELRDSINTPILIKMSNILCESEEERTQRILLEHLDIHE